MKAVVQWLGVALVALMLAACQGPEPVGPGVVKMQLKLYPVPAARSGAVVKHLGAVLEDARFRVGLKGDTSIRVTEPFPGAVLVLAPASLQPSIGTALAALNQRAGETANKPADKSTNKPADKPTTAVPVRVHFWVVQAKPGRGAAVPQLAALEPTLARVGKSLGPSHFVLNEAVSARLDAAPVGADGAAHRGSLLTNRQHKYVFVPHVQGNGDIVLDVQYTDASNATIARLQSTLSLRPGQYVVLAQAPGQEGAGKNATLMNLLVVRVDRLQPAAG